MSRIASFVLLLLTFTFFTTRANAQDRDTATPKQAWPDARISIAASGNMPFLFQAGPYGGNAVGLGFGPEVRAYFGRWHGLYASYNFVMSTQAIHVIEPGYSVRIVGSPEMRGVHGAIYADVGPSIAVVDGCLFCAVSAGGGGPSSSPSDRHAMIGLRAGLAADLYLYAFTIGIVANARAGFPTIDSGVTTEGALSIGVRIGATFDMSSSATKRTAQR